FWGLVLLWLQPWTAFIVQAANKAALAFRKWRLGLTRNERATVLFALWMLVIMVFFSFSSRQEYYVIPALPGLALLLGGWLAQETNSPLESGTRRSGRLSSLVLLAIGAAACIVCVLLAIQSAAPLQLRYRRTAQAQSRG